MVMSQTSLKDFRAGTSAGAAVTVILTLFFEDSAAFLRSAPGKVKPGNRLAANRSTFRERLYHPFRNFGAGTTLLIVSEIGGLRPHVPARAGRKLLCPSTRMKGGKEP